MTSSSTQRLARVGGLPCILLLQASISCMAFGAEAADQGAASPIGPDVLLECPDCDDGNVCTIDSCDTEFGTCRHNPVICDDGNQCTDDFCSPSSGCGAQPRYSVPCDDGSPCTFREICQGAGICTPATYSPVGSACDDGNPCTENEVCDEAHACTGTPLLAGTPCDDENQCTSADACVLDSSGKMICSGTPSPQTCDDGDPCWVDACDPAGGCYSYPLDCDDGNSCTEDSCEPATGRCLHLPGPEVACAGPSACAQYVCDRGNCTYVSGPPSCDDGIGCTRDLCAPESPSGCSHVPDASLCPQHSSFCRDYACVEEVGCVVIRDEEGEVCGGYSECLDATCQDGQCLPHSKGPETPCSAGNPCAIGHCESGGCLITGAHVGLDCDDGNVCTTNDHCNAQAVCVGSSITCPDDGYSCTLDVCLPGIGCYHPFDPAEACDDRNPCTTDSCPNTRDCEHAPRPRAECVVCEMAGFCDLIDVVSGTPYCSAPLPPSCDDGNPCTEPLFNPAACSCYQQPITQPVTCGVGACQRTINACDGGIPRECVPYVPGPEVCNGLDDDCDGIVPADESDPDGDGLRSCADSCPTVPNPDGNPCACAFCGAQDIVISFSSDLGKGSGTVSWRTAIEHDLAGFNIVQLDSRGNGTRLNPAIIPCQACVTDLGGEYAYVVPKHRSGRSIFIEQVRLDGRTDLFGPADRR